MTPHGAQILVLPSPLLGPAAYTAFVDALVRAGHDAYLASGAIAAAQDQSDVDAADPYGRDPSRIDPAGNDLSGGRAASRSAADRLVARWTDHAVRLDATALVAHSNAGFLAPIVRARVGRDLPVIFMDAALPPVSEPTTLAPEGFRAFLATLADDAGVLPPWTRWWPPEDLATLGPAALIEAVDHDCPRLPLAYFDSVVTPPIGWADASNGYIAFGDTYAEETRFAESARWPVVRVEGQHLHHAIAPEAVAQVVLTVLADLTERETS